MKSRICAACLVRNGDRILLGRKPRGRGPYPDTWHIPGGGVDLSVETAREAMAREINEETGLEVKNLEEMAWDTDIEKDKNGMPTYYVFLQFTADYSRGKLKAGDDITSSDIPTAKAVGLLGRWDPACASNTCRLKAAVSGACKMKSFRWVGIKDLKKFKLNKPTKNLIEKLGLIAD
ncbi:MAG: NUDIX domain-containing protein [Candidatus Aenigmarchaeota archaeon]|nr:NUDIX domain-containing protein [Candidatus Aenigmarchaeota archaeon]